MALKGFMRNIKPLELLGNEQIEAIHRGTLAVLEETGLRIEHERALKLFADHGCEVDFKKKRVRFPGGLVEECLRKAPSSFTIKARDPKNNLRIGGNTVYFTPAPGMRTVDLETWESRPATRKENADAVKILDALDSVHMLACYTPYFEVEGIPPAMAIPESDAAKIRNSTKVQFTGYSNDSELFTIKMGRVAKTEIFGQCCGSAPLTWYKEAIENAFRFVEAKLPLWISTGDIFGGTAPATFAGSMVATNAELMGMVVLTQLIRPGARIIPCDCVYPQNMQTGAPNFGAIGIALHQAMFYQIWRKYGIPTGSGATGFVNSKKIDFQSGYEKAALALIAALCGANIVPLHGALYGEITYHPVQSILDDDVAGMIGRFIEGVEVCHETLAIDLINEVGPIPGYYLNKEHTRKWWKKEQFLPKVADRLTYPEWIKKGKRDALTLAKEKMEEILATHQPTPLSPEQDKEIDSILEEARNYYQKKGLM